MKVYEITLPNYDNSNKDTQSQQREFGRYLLERVGGYTTYQAEGAWMDPKSGLIYHDRNTVYRFATDSDNAYGWTVRDAMNLFPDQKAIYAAEIGTATIHNRPQ